MAFSIDMSLVWQQCGHTYYKTYKIQAQWCFLEPRPDIKNGYCPYGSRYLRAESIALGKRRATARALSETGTPYSLSRSSQDDEKLI